MVKSSVQANTRVDSGMEYQAADHATKEPEGNEG